MDITNYIENELYIIVPVLYVIGIIFKKTEAIDDRWIPILLGVMGILLATGYKWANYLPTNPAEYVAIIYAGITQGILCAAASVYANNILKQIKKDDDETGSKGDSGNS